FHIWVGLARAIGFAGSRNFGIRGTAQTAHHRRGRTERRHGRQRRGLGCRSRGLHRDLHAKKAWSLVAAGARSMWRGGGCRYWHTANRAGFAPYRYLGKHPRAVARKAAAT